jgi:hypothetical protein
MMYAGSGAADGRRAALRPYDASMRVASHGLVVFGALLACSCGSSDREDRGRGDPTESCLDYCQRLRENGGGCGSDVENCASDCEMWIRDNEDASCASEFDGLLSCTSGIDKVCEAEGNECQQSTSDWLGCVEQCGVPSEVLFDPPCTTMEPCKSGTVVTIRSDKSLKCSVRVVMECVGGTATGYIPAGDPATESGTFELSCAQASSCIMHVDAANRYLEGATGVSCTP